MKNNKDKSTEPHNSEIDERRKSELNLLALKKKRCEIREMKINQGANPGAIIMPWDFGDMEEPKGATTPKEVDYNLKLAANQIEIEYGLPHPGRKNKTDEDRTQAADMAHEMYLKGDKKKYSHTGGKNAIANIVAKNIHSTSRTVLRDWKKIYPEDFSE